MPQLPFADEHKANTGIGDFPRLKLDRDERKRILCLEDPTFAYVHELRAPKIVSGKAEKKTIERKDGSSFTDFVYDFVGRPLCLGDLGILTDKGVDPKNCPACARSVATDEVAPPKRRFAMPVIVYATKPGSFELREPFSCELVVWSFTDKAYNKLVDIVSEWGENGKIRNHDLNLGPCTNKDFQTYEIAVANTAAWSMSDERRKHVLETYQHNKPNDLEAFCGRKVERNWINQDLDKIADRWKVANGVTEVPAGPQQSLKDGLGELLDEKPVSGAPSTPQQAELDLGDLFNDGKPKEDKPASYSPKQDAISFDSLLDSLQ